MQLPTNFHYPAAYKQSAICILLCRSGVEDKVDVVTDFTHKNQKLASLAERTISRSHLVDLIDLMQYVVDLDNKYHYARTTLVVQSLVQCQRADFCGSYKWRIFFAVVGVAFVLFLRNQ